MRCRGAVVEAVAESRDVMVGRYGMPCKRSHGMVDVDACLEGTLDERMSGLDGWRCVDCGEGLDSEVLRSWAASRSRPNQVAERQSDNSVSLYSIEWRCGCKSLVHGAKEQDMQVMNVQMRLAYGAMAVGLMMMIGGCGQWAGAPISADGGYEYRQRGTHGTALVGDDRAGRIVALEQELREALAVEQQHNASLRLQSGRVGDLERQLAAREQELGVLRDTVSGNPHEIARLTGQLTQGKIALDERARVQREETSVEIAASDRNHEIAALQPLPEPQDGRLAKAEEELVASMQPEIVKGLVIVQQLGDHLAITLSSRLLFESGKDTVNMAGADVLKRIGTVLKDFPEKSVQVDGHTDNVAIRGALLKKFPNNQALSKSRAVNVLGILRQGGVAEARSESTGYADTKPIASNDTEAGRQKNRRVEIVVSQLRVQPLNAF